jgi:hypothetical protein
MKPNRWAAPARVAVAVSPARLRATCVALTLLVASLSVRPASPAPSEARWYTVTSGATIQSTIDSCAAAGGGVVYFPPGVYQLPAGNAIYLRRSPDGRSLRTPGITLLGDGIDVSVIRTTVSDTILEIMKYNVTLQGLTFECPDTAGAPAPGIVLGDRSDDALSPYSQHVMSHLRVRDCLVRSTNGPAFVALPYPDLSIECEFSHCCFRTNFRDTLVKIGYGNTTFAFNECEFVGFPVTAVSVRGADGIHFTNCVFEGERGDNGPFFYADEAVNCSIVGGWFEDDPGLAGKGRASSQWFVHLDRSCHSFTLDGCTFRRAGIDVASQNPKMLKVTGTTGGAHGLREESVGVLVQNPEILTAAPLSTTADYIQVSSDSTDVTLVGGFARQSWNKIPHPIRARSAHARRPTP